MFSANLLFTQGMKISFEYGKKRFQYLLNLLTNTSKSLTFATISFSKFFTANDRINCHKLHRFYSFWLSLRILPYKLDLFRTKRLIEWICMREKVNKPGHLFSISKLSLHYYNLANSDFLAFIFLITQKMFELCLVLRSFWKSHHWLNT